VLTNFFVLILFTISWNYYLKKVEYSLNFEKFIFVQKTVLSVVV